MEKDYKNTDTNMNYICRRHPDKVQNIKLYNFNNGKGCKLCANEKLSESKRHSFDYVKSKFEERGYELLEENYKNNETKMKYRCMNHSDKINEITFGSLISGNGCKICANEKLSKSKRMNIDDIAKIFENKNLKLISNNYENSKTNLNYVCNIHSETIQSTTYSSIRSSKLTPCKECIKERLSNKYSNEKHWMWKGGITPKNKILRTCNKYTRWRELVFNRDNHTCQCCNKKGVLLNAHHILNFSQYEDLIYDVTNGTTLCQECHRKFHNIYGTKNNNEIQLIEFYEKWVK